MPTILRFLGFNIVIYVFDHDPPHVHAKSGSKHLIVTLGCRGELPAARGRFGVSPAEEAALIRFIEENRDILCKAWEELHGDPGKA